MKNVFTKERVGLFVLAIVAAVTVSIPGPAEAATSPSALAVRCKSALVIGHRGTVAGGVHENTIRAFSSAITSGAEVIELDIHRTKDGQWVVNHDASIRGHKISKTKYKTLKKLKSDLTTYRQTMNYLRTQKVRVSVEIKPKSVRNGSLRYFARVIKQYNMQNRVEITSFSSAVLKKFHGKSVRKYTTGIRTGYIVNNASNLRQGPASIRKFANVLILRKDMIKTTTQVATYNRYGLRVDAYTLDNSADWTRMLNLGTNGIITDYAGAYNKWCASIQPKPPVSPVSPL